MKAHGAKYRLPIVLAYFAECGLPRPVPEFRFHPDRKWRFDFCWVQEKVGLECQGGLFIQGGHNRGSQIRKEHEKYNEAARLGFRILFCEPNTLCTQDMVDIIRSALNL